MSDLIFEFIDSQTRSVSRAWISNDALYKAFLRWIPRGLKLISFQAFSRYLGHGLKILNVRHWIDGHQIYGRQLWPLEEIREGLNFGSDYL